MFVSDKQPTQTQVHFKAFQPNQWPVTLSKAQRKFHEHTRCRGFTEEEVRFFKVHGRWVNGQVAEPKVAQAA